MNKVIEVYTELDSLFDSKRGILQHLYTPGLVEDDSLKVESDRKWDLYFAKNYVERRLDTFSYPEFSITRETFDNLYSKRELSHWAVFYPTPLIDRIVKTVIELEGMGNKPISISSMNVTVNTFPYQLDDALREELVRTLNLALKGLGGVKLTETDPAKNNSRYYSRYNYVFKYDILTGKESKVFVESLKGDPIPDVAFVIPDILVKDTGDFVGEVSDIIFASSLSLLPVAKFIPIKHAIYDYR